MRRNEYADSTTETFFSRNVRLITFLICVALLLGVGIPVIGYHMYGYFHTEEVKKPVMGEEELLGLFDYLGAVDLSVFDPFRSDAVGEWTVGGRTGKTLFVDVGEHCYLTVMEDVQSCVIVYAVLTDRQTREELDLLDKTTHKQDVRSFFAQH